MVFSYDYLSAIDAIRPAVHGTLNILESARKYGYVTIPVNKKSEQDSNYPLKFHVSRNEVKRIVITGSISAAIDGLFGAADEVHFTRLLHIFSNRA